MTSSRREPPMHVVSIWLIAIPGADRPYVQTREPDAATARYWRHERGAVIYLAQIRVPALTIVDGVVQVDAALAAEPAEAVEDGPKGLGA
jgi:hypothetical protein